MEIVLVCAAFFGALVLLAPPIQPAPRPEVIVIQARPESQAEGDLGCLPLLICALFAILVVSAL